MSILMALIEINMLLIISALFLLAFLLLGVLIGRVAKKRGKNPWLWGVTSFLLITAISWKQLPTWAFKIYNKGMVTMQSVKPKESVTTLAEAKKINIAASVAGVNFDVPLTYLFRGYSHKDGGWLAVSNRVETTGTVRPSVDYINIEALMPDLAPLREDNLADFEMPGFGKTVSASLTHIIRPLDCGSDYENNPNVEKRPESPEVPGMLHYYVGGSGDLYISHSCATPDLTNITCDDPNVSHHVSPYCKIETSYRPPTALLASIHKEGTIFRLEYSFSSQYLSQWRDIDRKLKSLFDQFILTAAQHSPAHP